MSFNTYHPQSTPPTSSSDEVFHTPRSQIARSSPLREEESSSFLDNSWGGFSPIAPAPPTEPNESHKTAFSDDEFEDDGVGFNAKPSFKDANGSPQQFVSKFAVKDYLQQFAQGHGFAIKFGRSKTRKHEKTPYKYWFNCVCGGQKHNTKVALLNRERTSRGRHCGCKWSAVCVEKDESWTVHILKAYHNHPQSFGGTYPAQRRVAQRAIPGVRERILADTRVSTITAKDTHSAVQIQYPEIPIKLADIYNLQANQQSEKDQGLPAIQALVRELGEDFHFHYSTDKHERLINLVFFKKDCTELLRRWPYTIILDATYKSNKFNLYLVDIAGITATGRTFIIGQAFLSSEETEDYQYVLEWLRDIYIVAGLNMPVSITTDKAGGLLTALKIVFPTVRHLLCLWHINTDVLKYCKRLWRDELVRNVGGDSFAIYSDDELPQPPPEAVFRQDSSLITAEEKKQYMATKEGQFLPLWNAVTNAVTPEATDKAWQALRQRYVHEYAVVIKYLDKTWMSHREKFCKAWTSDISHFGSITSGRAEAAHRAVKHKLPHGRLHLRKVVDIMKLYVDELNKNILSDIEDDRTALGDYFKQPVYHRLRHRISIFAIKKINEHLAFFKESHSTALPPCKGTFSRIWGIPCAHTIYSKNEVFERLTINDFHEQWHLDKGKDNIPIDPSLLLRDPVVIRERASGKKTKTGRTRSGFETVNSEVEMLTRSPKKKKQQRKITGFSWSSQPVSKIGPSRRTPVSPRAPQSSVYRDRMVLKDPRREPTVNELVNYNRWQQAYTFVGASDYFYNGQCTIGNDAVGEHDEHGWTDLSKTPNANNDEFDNPEYEEEIYNYFNEPGMSKQDKEYEVDLLEDWYAAQAIKSRILPENPMTYNDWLTQVNVPSVKGTTEARRHHLSRDEIVRLVTQREEIRIASLRELGRDDHGQPLKEQHREQDTVIDSIEQDQIPPRRSSLKRRRGSDSELRERQGAYRGTRSRSRRVQFSEPALNDSDSDS
jgi:hypothetical protein